MTPEGQRVLQSSRELAQLRSGRLPTPTETSDETYSLGPATAWDRGEAVREALLATEMTAVTRVLVAANVALRRNGLTLGECDFLVQTQTSRRLHWELAVKCYLHAGESRAQLADYVGPNLQDRFDVKLRRLLEHQLPLSARAEFASLGHVGPWEAQMFVKGWLFYRDGGTPAEPAGIDPNHARGWWTTRADWPSFAAARGDAWAVLPRLQWLSRRRRSGDAAAAGLFDIAALRAQLAQHSGPTMVAAFAADDKDGGWRETSRGFVVPDAWPALALAFARG